MLADENIATNEVAKEVEPIVVRKEHTKCLWFWNAFYGVMSFLENHIPHNILQFFKYSILSASAGAVELIFNSILTVALQDVDLGTTPYILGPIAVNVLIPTLVGLVLGILWNFTVNRKFTFHSAGNVPRAMMFVIAFYTVITPLKTLWNAELTKLLFDVMGSGAEIFVNLCGMLVIGILEFCYQKFIVYRKEENSALKDKQ